MFIATCMNTIVLESGVGVEIIPGQVAVLFKELLLESQGPRQEERINIAKVIEKDLSP